MLQPNKSCIYVQDNMQNQIYVDLSNLVKCYQIKGIIYDCQHLSSVDVTALTVVLEIILNFKEDNSTVIKFSNIPKNILKDF